MKIEIPEDTKLLLAKLRTKLSLDPFASIPEVIRAIALVLLEEPTRFEGLREARVSRPKQRQAWPPERTWVIGDQTINPGATQAEQLGNGLQRLAEANPQFLELFARHCKSAKGRSWLSHDREQLYPGNASLSKSQAREVPGFEGWWYGTNYSAEVKRRIIQEACQIAGQSFREV